jgi:spermidine synthase
MKDMIVENGKFFKSAEYASMQTPTYPCGQICAFMLSKSRDSLRTPARQVSAEMEETLQYYSSEMHTAAFALPLFVKRALAGRKAEKRALEKSADVEGPPAKKVAVSASGA